MAYRPELSWLDRVADPSGFPPDPATFEKETNADPTCKKTGFRYESYTNIDLINFIIKVIFEFVQTGSGSDQYFFKPDPEPTKTPELGSATL